MKITRASMLTGLVLYWITTQGVLAQTMPAAETPQQILEATAFESEPFGMTIRPPLGAVIAADKSAEQLSYMISEGSESPRWSIRLQMMQTNRPEPSAAQHIRDQLERIEASGREFQVLSNAPRTIDDRQAHLCYLQQAGASGAFYVTGWLVIPTDEPTTFLVCTLLTLPEHFPTIKPLIEASFDTIMLRSRAQVNLEQGNRLAAGNQFLASLSEDAIRQHVGRSEWFRIYRRVGSDRVTEVGYVLVEMREGVRGELTPERDSSKYEDAEREPGLVVMVQGRIVENADSGRYVDSYSVYWMTWDQSEEAWSIRTTLRQGQASRSFAETGIREPRAATNPRPKLTVIRSGAESFDREPFTWPVPEVYISQALGWHTGALLPRDSSEAQEFAYYTYNPTGDSPQVTLRIDRWEPGERTGEWVLTTRLGSDQPPYVTIYDASGRIVRRTNPDGTISEPTSREALRTIWGRKGLRISN